MCIYTDNIGNQEVFCFLLLGGGAGKICNTLFMHLVGKAHNVKVLMSAENALFHCNSDLQCSISISTLAVVNILWYRLVGAEGSEDSYCGLG
jgi:hypothetical protein